MTSDYQVLYGQRSAAMQISIKNGLPSNVVYEIEMDSRGFLWAATDKGIVRYDGRKFRVFTTDDGLLSNDNFKIIIDKEDNVWLYALTGISKIDKTFQCHVISRHKAYYSFFVMNKKNEIITYQIDSFDSNNGAKKSAFGIIKNNTMSKVPFYYPSSEYNQWVNSYHYFINDTLFIVGSDKNKNKILYFLDATSNKITISDRTYIHKITHKSESDFDNSKKELFQINSTYSIVLKKDTYIFVKKEKIIKELPYPDNQKRSLEHNIIKHRGETFIIFENAIYIFKIHPDGRNEWQLFCDIKNAVSIVFDSEENIWVSTLGNGIFKFPYLSPNIEISSYKFLSTQKVIKLAGYKKKILWAATSENKVFELNSNTILPHNDLFDIRFLLCDSTDVYYGGGWSVYKNHVRIQTGRGFKNACLLKDNLALVSYEGMAYLSKNNLKKQLITPDYLYLGIAGRAYSVLVVGNTIYIGKENGLWFKRAQNTPMLPIVLKPDFNVTVNNIEKSSDGRIWVSTEGEGVFVLENNKVLVQFKEELLDKTIHSMHIDENDNIWLGTMYGINCIVKNSGKYSIKSYTQFHGLPDNYVFDTYCYDNTLYAATESGLISFDISRLDAINSKSNTPAYILGIENLSIPGSSLTVDSAYTFKYNENTIRFTYTGISYRSNGKIQFEYRLLPTVQNWTRTDNDNTIFTDLDAGTYTFEVRAINSLGFAGLQSAKYSFVIKRHFSKEPWFIATTIFTIVLLTAGGIYLYTKHKRKQIMLEADISKRLAELKLSLLQSQLNPHFIFNCLNSIQHMVLNEDKAKASEFLVSFSRLIRYYLDGSEQQFVTLQNELNFLCDFCKLEHSRFSDKFDYMFEVDPEIQTENQKVPAMLLQPYVENAIKHGLIPLKRRKGLLKISIKKTYEGLLCTVEDNGIGRKTSKENKILNGKKHIPMGGKIAFERLQIINKLNTVQIHEVITDIIRDGREEGTKVELYINNTKNNNTKIDA